MGHHHRGGVIAIIVATLTLAAWSTASARAPAGADPDVTAAIDRYVGAQMAGLHIPGLALALIVDGKVAYERGYGVADTSGRPVTPETPFVIGSTSKQFTGLAVEQLVRTGKLDLDSPVRRYLPWFGPGDDPHGRITIRELLSHTAGIGFTTGVDNMGRDGGPDDTLGANARRLAQEPLLSPPGSTFAYTDSDYNLLGYLVEVASGVSFADYMREHVFAPLGLQATFASDADARAAGLAASFYPWFGLVALPTPMPYPRSSVPSGFLISSAHDLATLVRAHLGVVPAGQTEVDAALLAATRTPLTTVAPDLRYAAGWYVQRFWQAAVPGEDWQDPALPLFYAHVGQVSEGRSFIGFVPERGFGLVLAMNANDRTQAARWESLGDAIIRLALGREPVPVAAADPLYEYARLIYLLVALAQLMVGAWALRARHWRRIAIGSALVVDVAALGFALLYAPGAAGMPLPVLVRLVPDLGLMTALIVAFGVGWLALAARQAYRERPAGSRSPATAA